MNCELICPEFDFLIIALGEFLLYRNNFCPQTPDEKKEFDYAGILVSIIRSLTTTTRM